MHSGIKFGVKIDDFQVVCRCIATALVIFFAWLITKSDKLLVLSKVTTNPNFKINSTVRSLQRNSRRMH